MGKDDEMNEADKNALIDRLDELIQEFEDCIDEIGRAFEPVRFILDDFERESGVKIIRRGDLAGIEHFIGVMSWMGTGPSAEKMAEDMHEVIREIIDTEPA